MILTTSLALVFFLILVPYHLYFSGELHYFLYAFHLVDPKLFARDWLVTQTANPHPFFASLIALLKSLGDLPLALFAIHVAQFFFLVLGILRLSTLLTKDSRTGPLVLALLLFYFSDGLGQETLYSAIVQPADLGKLFYLFSLIALFQERILQSWALLGLTALFDFLSGAEGFLLLSSFWLIRARHWNFWKVATGFFLFLVFSSPSLLAILRNFSPFDSFHSPEALQTLFNFRGPHHYRIGTFELAHVFRVLFPLFFLLVGNKQNDKESSNVRFYAASLSFLCLLAAASIEWFYVAPIVQLRFLRLSPFLLILGLIYLAFRLIQEWDSKTFSGRILAGVTLAVLFLEKDSRLFVPLSLFLVVLWSFRRAMPFSLLIASFAVPLVFYVAWGRETELILDVSLSLALLFLLKLKTNRTPVRILFTLLVLGIPSLALHQIYPERIDFHPIQIAPPSPFLAENPDLEEVLRWIRNNTPKDAQLISPPYQDGIRFFSERAIVADFHANPYGAREVREWMRRLEALSQTESLEKWIPSTGDTTPQRALLRRGYLGLSAARVEELGQQFSADYFLTESDYQDKQSLIDQGHRIVFENSSYLFFQLKRTP